MASDGATANRQIPDRIFGHIVTSLRKYSVANFPTPVYIYNAPAEGVPLGILGTEINKHFQLLFETTLTLTLRHSDVIVV